MRQRYLSTERQNQHLGFLIDPCFQGANRLSVSSFEMKAIEKYTQDIIFQKQKRKKTTLWLMEKTFLIGQLKVIQDYIRFAKLQQVVCQTIILKHYYRMIAIDLSKEKALDAEPKAMQQINFTGNLKNQLTIFSITEEAKETVLDFSQGTVKVFYFCFKMKRINITL